MSSETAAKELRTLKAIFNKAVEWGEIEKSPAKSVKAPKNLRSQPIHWYTKAELARLYKHSNYAAIWRLMANTGLRRMEALQLRWIDVKKDHIQVLSTEEDRTKSGKWRQVPLSDSALIALRALKRRTGKQTYVLPRMTGPSLSRAFRIDVEARKLAGSLHSLRHTYGAHLVMAAVPLRTVQVLMGHASYVTTERYAHVGGDHLRDQARLINL
jgi:integrase